MKVGDKHIQGPDQYLVGQANTFAGMVRIYRTGEIYSVTVDDIVRHLRCDCTTVITACMMYLHSENYHWTRKSKG